MGTIYDNDLELIEAAGEGDIERDRLLRRGADPNAKDVIHRGTPLQAAAVGGHLDIVKLLVRCGADINMEAGDVAQTALEVAAIAGRVRVVEWLVEAGATVPTGTALQSLLADLQTWNENQIIELLKRASP